MIAFATHILIKLVFYIVSL